MKDKYGATYDAWSRSTDRQINCVQERTGRKLWTCTRIAKPCVGVAIIGGPTGGVLPAFADLEPLKLTSPRTKGDQVTLLQQYLNLHGATLTADGEFGTNTAQAVTEYQRKEGLDGDGGTALAKQQAWKLVPIMVGCMRVL